MRASFELRIGSLSSTDDNPAAGPGPVVVDRDVDVALDVARVRLTHRHDVAVGDSCTVALGMAGAAEHVFGGTVVELRADVTGTTVVAAGTMSGLLDLYIAATYTDTTLGTVARDLAGRAGMSLGDVVEGSQLPWFVVDARRSAHAQLRDLAARFGAHVYADRDGRLVVRSLPGGGPGGGLGGGPSLPVAGVPSSRSTAVRFGTDVIDARSRLKAPPWDAVTVGGESPASTEGATAASWLTGDDSAAQGEAGSGDRRLLLVDPLARTKDLARDLADGILRFAGRRAHVAEVVVAGRPATDLGDQIEISNGDGSTGLPAGTGHVRRLRHRLDGVGGFSTRLGVALPSPGLDVAS